MTKGVERGTLPRIHHGPGVGTPGPDEVSLRGTTKNQHATLLSVLAHLCAVHGAAAACREDTHMPEPRRRKPNAAYVRKDPSRWKHEGWTSTPNSVTRDPDIPPDECWAWTWLASHDDDFEVSGKVLYEAKKDLSRNRAYELLSNLERRGLLLRYHVFDEASGIPYVQYDLQPRPVPEEDRTWVPSKAKPRKRPHPGSKAVRAEPVDNPVSAGHDGFPTGRESPPTRTFPARRESGIPDGPGIPSDQDFPDASGERGSSRRAGSRQAGNPYIEEKISPEEREREKEGPLREPAAPPSVEAQEMLRALTYGRHRPPRQAELLELAGLVDAAVIQGLTLPEVKRYAQTVINGAATSAVGFLRGGLQPDLLPVPLRPRGCRPCHDRTDPYPSRPRRARAGRPRRDGSPSNRNRVPTRPPIVTRSTRRASWWDTRHHRLPDRCSGRHWSVWADRVRANVQVQKPIWATIAQSTTSSRRPGCRPRSTATRRSGRSG